MYLCATTQWWHEGNSAYKSNGTEPDTLVDINKAAAILGVKVRYLYDNEFPFTRRVGRQLRFSLRGLQRYMAKKR